MTLRALTRAALAAALVVLAGSTSLSARQWNPDGRAAALDYSQIFHTKAAGDIVIVWWVVPETFLTTGASQNVRDVLSRYVIIGAGHGHAAPGVNPTFDNVRPPTIGDATGRSLSPLNNNTLPQTVTETVTNLQMLARQSLGPMGAGLRWFVFDSSTIHSCERGRMTVPFEGEVYSYDTPIPGCPAQP